MMEAIRSELRGMALDWYRYMNTSIPEKVDKRKYTDMVYSNKGKKLQLLDKYEDIDSRVIEEVALHEFLMKSEEEIIEATRIVRRQQL